MAKKKGNKRNFPKRKRSDEKENKHMKSECKLKGKNASSKVIRRKKKSERNYSSSSIQEALNAIEDGQSLRSAASQFHIPKSTLYLKYANLSAIDCRKGPATVLSEEVENEIVEWILFCAKNGFPVTKSQLLDCIEKYVVDNKLKTPFKNNRPGKHWYNAFMKRHSNLSKRIAQNLTSTRASVAEEDLRNWFSKVEQCLKEKDLLSIGPERIFNLDESSFMLVPKDNSVITEKGTRAPYQIVSNNDKACLNVLFTVSAAGIIVPPMILFDLKTVPKKTTLNKIPQGWSVGNTERGWMTSDSFYCFISNIFFKWLQDNNYIFPIILYVDGHVSHITLPLLKFCKTNQIELVILYPNSTHVIQPLDVAVFHPVKEKYRTVNRQYRIDNNLIKFTKSDFAAVLKLTLDSMDLKSTILNGFRACGLYPFDPDAVSYNVLNKKMKTQSSKEPSSDSNVNKNTSSDNNNYQLLKLFESSIMSLSVVEAFKEDEFKESWTGDSKYELLFETWKKMKRLCQNSEDSHDTTVTYSKEDECTHSDESAGNVYDQITEESILDTSSTTPQASPSVRENCEVESVFLRPGMEIYDEFGNPIRGVINITCSVNENSNDPLISPISISQDSFSNTFFEDGSNQPLVDVHTNVEQILIVQDESSTVSANTFDANSIETCSAEANSNMENYDDNPPDCTDDVKSTSAIDDIISEASTDEINSSPGSKFNNFTVDQMNSTSVQSTSDISLSQTNKVLKNVANMPQFIALDGDNAVNLNVNVDDSNENVREKSSENTINNTSENDINLSPNLKASFPIPDIHWKKKKQNQTKAKFRDSPSVSTVDDLLKIMEKKESEKQLKEQQFLMNRQKRERNKAMKEKEQNIKKQLQENKKKLQNEKKNVKLQIKELVKVIRSENGKENKSKFEEQQKKLENKLEEIEQALINLEMKALQMKKTIKQEKM